MMADMKCKEHQLKKRFFSRSIVVKVGGQMKRGTKCDLSSAQLIFKAPLLQLTVLYNGLKLPKIVLHYLVVHFGKLTSTQFILLCL